MEQAPDWWLNRLYGKLHKRRPIIDGWDKLYSGEHPAPQGHEKAGPLLNRLLETIGLNILAGVTDAAHERMIVEGFRITGRGGSAAADAVALAWQDSHFDLGSSQVFLESMGTSIAYAMVDPNGGSPIITPEHPAQCITETDPRTGKRIAGLKVWQDDTDTAPLVWAQLDTGTRIEMYAAKSRLGNYAMKPQWEYQGSESGPNTLGEVALIPFANRPRMLRDPRPEFYPAIETQFRINKTLLDRMAMQDQGSFKAMWATGIAIPRDPATGKPVENFVKAIDRMFINENPEGRFGQLEAEDIKQILEAVNEDIKHAAILVPTPPDQLLGELVNVSEGGLKSAQASLITRVRRHMRAADEPLEDIAQLVLKASGKAVPNARNITTLWKNPEYRTEGELVDSLVKAQSFGVPQEALWERYGATPDERVEWRRMADEAAQRDPILNASRALTGGTDAADTGA